MGIRVGARVCDAWIINWSGWSWQGCDKDNDPSLDGSTNTSLRWCTRVAAAHD